MQTLLNRIPDWLGCTAAFLTICAYAYGLWVLA